MWWALLLNSIVSILDSGVAASTTAYESIATTTVGGGGAATVTFSSIPATYTHLQIRFLAQGGAVGLNCRMNGNTSADYTSHFVYGDGSGVAAQGTTSETFIPCGRLPTSSYFGAGVIDILDYKDTNKYKTLRSLAGNDQNGSGSMWLFSGLYQYTTAVSSLTFFSSTGNLAQYSSFALYGIKGA
jgi:hypothetical protein